MKLAIGSSISYILTDFPQILVRKTNFFIVVFDNSRKFWAFIALRRSFFYRTILQNVKYFTSSGGFAPGPRISMFLLIVRWFRCKKCVSYGTFPPIIFKNFQTSGGGGSAGAAEGKWFGGLKFRDQKLLCPKRKKFKFFR